MTAFREDAEFAVGADDGIAVGPRGRVWRTGSRLQNVIKFVQKMQFCNDTLQFRTVEWRKCHIISAFGCRRPEAECQMPVAGSPIPRYRKPDVQAVADAGSS